MKKYVKVTSILLFTMIVMLCTCVFASAEEYGVWVGGVQVTSDNAEDVLGDGTVSYDAVTSTLTLDNANITDCYHIVNYDNVMCYGLYFTHSLNLYVKGECNIVPECTDSLYEGFGISKGTDNISLTIYGDGKENVLTVCAPAAVNKSCGINMECCDITIRNLSVNAYGNRSENDSHGIYTLGTSTLIDGSVVYKYGGNLVIENADINSYGGDVASLTGKAVSNAIYGRIITISGDSDVYAEGGNVECVNGGSSSGLIATMQFIVNDNSVVNCYGKTIINGIAAEDTDEDTEGGTEDGTGQSSTEVLSVGISIVLGSLEVSDNAIVNGFGGVALSENEQQQSASFGIMSTLGTNCSDNGEINGYGGKSNDASAGVFTIISKVTGGVVNGYIDNDCDAEIKAGIAVIQLEESTVYDTKTGEILTYGGEEKGYINLVGLYPQEASIIPGIYNGYPIAVGGVQVNDFNKDDVFGDGTVCYDPETNTLTLNNADIEGAIEVEGFGTAAIYTKIPLNIVVDGNCSVSTNTQGSSMDAGIIYYGDELEEGTPAISISGGKDDVLNINTSDASEITAIIGSVSGDVVFSEVTVNAVGGSTGVSSFGIVAGLNNPSDIIVDGAVVNVDTGDVVANENVDYVNSFGVKAENVDITNKGELNIIGGNINSPDGGLIQGTNITGDLTLSGESSITAIGGNVTSTSEQFHSANVPTSGGIVVSGSITATENSYVFGVGGDITNNANEENIGISAGVVSGVEGSLNVDGLSKIEGVGGDSPNTSVGVFAGDINLNLGTLSGTSDSDAPQSTGVVSGNTPNMPNAEIYDSVTSEQLTYSEEQETFVDAEGNVSTNVVAATLMEFDIWIGGVQVTTNNMYDVLGDGTVCYDYETNTLILDNANLTTSYVFSGTDSNKNSAVIYTTNPLNILIKGDCLIESDAVGSYSDYGIICEADYINGLPEEFISITGADENASLVVKTNDSEYDSCPINGESINVKISNLNLECTTGSSIEPLAILGRNSSIYIENSIVNSTSLTASSCSSALAAFYGIYITDGSEVTATAGDCINTGSGLAWSYAIWGGYEIVIDGESTVVATSGNVDSGNNAVSIAVISNNVSVSENSVVEATSGEVHSSSTEECELISNGVRGYESLNFPDGTGAIYTTVNCTNDKATIMNVCSQQPAINATVKDAVTGEILTYDAAKETYVDSNGNVSTQVSVNGGIILFGDYNLAVGGIIVTEENANDILGNLDGEAATAHYNPETKTLTLDNAEITGYFNMNEAYVGIASYGNLNIKLVGENKVYNTSYTDSPSMSAGVAVLGNLTIDSNNYATLDVKTGSATDQNFGIYVTDAAGNGSAKAVLSGKVTVNIHTGDVEENVYGMNGGAYIVGSLDVTEHANINAYASIALATEDAGYHNCLSIGIVVANKFTVNTTGKVYGYGEKSSTVFGGIAMLGGAEVLNGTVIGESGTDVPTGATAAGLAVKEDIENVVVKTGASAQELYSENFWYEIDSTYGGVYLYGDNVVGTYTKITSEKLLSDLVVKKDTQDEDGDGDADETYVSITVTGYDNVIIAFASYEQNGRMVDATYMPGNAADVNGEIHTELDLTDAVRVKAFAFENSMALKPVCDCVETVDLIPVE